VFEIVCDASDYCLPACEVGFFETDTCETAHCHMLDASDLYSDCCENVKHNKNHILQDRC